MVANWDSVRPPSPTDLRKTLVLELPLTEASAKVRTGDPVDEPDDIAGPWWAGVVPITTRFEPPTTSADLTSGAEPPASDSRPGRPHPRRAASARAGLSGASEAVGGRGRI